MMYSLTERGERNTEKELALAFGSDGDYVKVTIYEPRSGTNGRDLASIMVTVAELQDAITHATAPPKPWGDPVPEEAPLNHNMFYPSDNWRHSE